MVADEMLTRKRYREVPPRVEYELTERARELMPVLGELAKWGYEWAWGPPRETESVDLGAFFRLAPGLIPLNGSRGTVEFTIEDGEDRRSYCCSVSANGVIVQEREPGEPDARVSGTRSAWVKALLPEHDWEELEISGNRGLAETLLAHLVAESPSASEGPAVLPESRAAAG